MWLLSQLAPAAAAYSILISVLRIFFAVLIQLLIADALSAGTSGFFQGTTNLLHEATPGYRLTETFILVNKMFFERIIVTSKPEPNNTFC